MILYRGFKNIYEMKTVLENRTAGGLKSLCLDDFHEGKDGAKVILENRKGLRGEPGNLKNHEIARLENYMRIHRGTDGEDFPRMQNIPMSRCVTEYTLDEGTASGFGRLLGYIAVEADEKYVAEDIEAIEAAKKSPESGLYLFSDAPVEILGVSITDKINDSDRQFLNDINSLRKLAGLEPVKG